MPPQIKVEGRTGDQAASPAEAAAISAAIQRFETDTAVVAPPEPAGISSWLRAALVEGVSGKDDFGRQDPRELF